MIAPSTLSEPSAWTVEMTHSGLIVIRDASDRQVGSIARSDMPYQFQFTSELKVDRSSQYSELWYSWFFHEGNYTVTSVDQPSRQDAQALGESIQTFFKEWVNTPQAK